MTELCEVGKVEMARIRGCKMQGKDHYNKIFRKHLIDWRQPRKGINSVLLEFKLAMDCQHSIVHIAGGMGKATAHQGKYF